MSLLRPQTGSCPSASSGLALGRAFVASSPTINSCDVHCRDGQQSINQPATQSPPHPHHSLPPLLSHSHSHSLVPLFDIR